MGKSVFLCIYRLNRTATTLPNDVTSWLRNSIAKVLEFIIFFLVCTVKLKLNVEFDQEGRALSLDQFTKILLEAVQKVVRQELERWHVAHPVPVEKPAAPPETKRALGVSKAEAAKILAVSRRTIDYSTTLREIKVFRAGRRVLVPVEGLEAIVKRGALRTRDMDDSDARS